MVCVRCHYCWWGRAAQKEVGCRFSWNITPANLFNAANAQILWCNHFSCYNPFAFCKSILSRGPIIEGGNSIGRGERWLLLPILLKYYIAKAAQQTMQCKVTFVEVVLLPNIKEKQWSGFAQVVFFCHLAEEEEEQCVSLQESFKAKMVANCHDTLLCRQFEW